MVSIPICVYVCVCRLCVCACVCVSERDVCIGFYELLLALLLLLFQLLLQLRPALTFYLLPAIIRVANDTHRTLAAKDCASATAMR